jgi:hypothetical protein
MSDPIGRALRSTVAARIALRNGGVSWPSRWVTVMDDAWKEGWMTRPHVGRRTWMGGTHGKGVLIWTVAFHWSENGARTTMVVTRLYLIDDREWVQRWSYDGERSGEERVVLVELHHGSTLTRLAAAGFGGGLRFEPVPAAPPAAPRAGLTGRQRLALCATTPSPCPRRHIALVERGGER